MPCGPGVKGALVEMSNPNTEDRKGYLQRVVEGHQRQSPAPTVTTSTVSSGSGGSDGSDDKVAFCPSTHPVRSMGVGGGMRG